MSEYALILGGIALTCIVVLVVLGGGIAGVFDNTRDNVGRSGSGSFTPPSTLTWPTSLSDCDDPGWQDFPQFASEAGCDAYVNSLP
jgi:Flp pilus assembly pilin Flp